jgi:hypothetical protein
MFCPKEMQMQKTLAVRFAETRHPSCSESYAHCLNRNTPPSSLHSLPFTPRGRAGCASRSQEEVVVHRGDTGSLLRERTPSLPAVSSSDA